MTHRRKILEARKIAKSRKKHIDEEIGYAASRRQCWKKVAYSSEREVTRKIFDIAKEGRRSLRYYECPICNLYHISSKKIGTQKFIS